jgi:hypothetical protein
MNPGRLPQDQGLSLGDRLISALLGGLCGFATMLLIWLLVVHPRQDGEAQPPFSWTWIMGAFTAAAGFVVGPERMMDGLGRVWGAIGGPLWGERR